MVLLASTGAGETGAVHWAAGAGASPKLTQVTPMIPKDTDGANSFLAWRGLSVASPVDGVAVRFALEGVVVGKRAIVVHSIAP